tara:strand:+ start:1852 stop:2460 length:609 start_codon:yes stop_codon:yes gene_type:complete
MANNFKNSFATIVGAGEYYQVTGSATDNHTGPQMIYTANDGSTDVNSILIEVDASNTGSSAITLTSFIQDTSSTLGSITSVVSASDVATVTSGAAHGLKVGQYVHVTGSTTAYVNGVYKVASVPSTTTFTYAQNSSAADGTAAGTIVIYRAHHIIKDAPIPAGSTLKVVSGQKIVLNGGDKFYAYASAGTCDVIASVLEGVS